MKKLSILVIFVLLVSLVACGAPSVPNIADAVEEALQSAAEDLREDVEEIKEDAEEIKEEAEEIKEEAIETVETEEAAEPEPSKETAGPAWEVTDTRSTTWTDSIGSVWVQVIIEITNTGEVPLYLSSGGYDLETSDGALFDTESLVSVYPTVLEPGEKGYYREETTLDEAPDGDLTVIPHPDIKAAKIETIRFPVSDESIKPDDFNGLKMQGRVTNDSDEDESLLTVAAILYDADGRCIGVLNGYSDVPAGETMGFSISSMNLPEAVTPDAVASYTIYAYPLQMQF